MLRESCCGSTSTVSAWRSARKNRHSASSCIRTQRRIAPSKLPRWSPPVGWIPETTLIRSRGIDRRPLALQQHLQFLAVRAAKYPVQGEIDDHPAADDGDDAGKS